MNQEVTLSAIEELLDRKLEEKLEQKLDEKLSGIHTRLDSLEKRVGSLENGVSNLNEKMDKVDMRLRHVELTMENEITPNIMRVAEGHLDLNRKLNEAIKKDHERELLTVKLNYMYTEMQKWNERYQKMAQ